MLCLFWGKSGRKNRSKAPSLKSKGTEANVKRDHAIRKGAKPSVEKPKRAQQHHPDKGKH